MHMYDAPSPNPELYNLNPEPLSHDEFIPRDVVNCYGRVFLVASIC